MKTKHQAPNTKHQRSSKYQVPSRGAPGRLRFGSWNFSGAWGLGLGAFTLIELLVVIAIIAILASLVIPITAAVNRTKILTRARSDLANVETGIEAYKAARGHYPPDNPGNPATNQLYYELLGTRATNAFPTFYVTLDGSAQINEAQARVVWNTTIAGFMNCSRQAAGDDIQLATRCLRGLKPSQIGEFNVKNITVPVKFLVSVPWPDKTTSMFPGSTYNPIRYNSSSPTNNPNSYDLWVDVVIAGKTNRLSNWSSKPIVVYSPGN